MSGACLIPIHARSEGCAGSSVARVANKFHAWRLQRRLRALWRREKADVCHIQWFDERVWHCAKAGLRPLAATAWGSDLNMTMHLPIDDLARKRVSEALRRVDLLIVDSEDMIETAARLAGKEIPFVNIAIGIDTNKFRRDEDARRRWRVTLGIGAEAPVILSPRAVGPHYRQSK